jgi:hypothetical protein
MRFRAIHIRNVKKAKALSIAAKDGWIDNQVRNLMLGG